MNLWASPDRFMKIADAAGRRAQSDDLVAEIASSLSAVGEYVARIDMQPTQRIVDFNWAARQAGRRLGVRVDLRSRVIKDEGRLQVRVRAITPPR